MRWMIDSFEVHLFYCPRERTGFGPDRSQHSSAKAYKNSTAGQECESRTCTRFSERAKLINMDCLARRSF